MSEAGYSPESDRDENVLRFTRVYVKDISPKGEISLTQLFPVPEGPPFMPLTVKMPVMSKYAFQVLKFWLLRGKIFDWIPITGPACHYNIFFYISGNDATLDIFNQIMKSRLPKHLQLPEVNSSGTCRISPLCKPNNIYVQMQPEYVDTLTYYIYLIVDYLQVKGLISPAETIEFEKLYILSRGYENYRVIVSEEVTSKEPDRFHKKHFSPKNFVCRNYEYGLVKLDDQSSRKYRDPVLSGECETNINESTCWERDESEKGFGSENHDNTIFPPLKKITGDEVCVFPKDFGGPIIRVHRRYLFDVEAVDEKLRDIPELSFPVIFKSINTSTDQIEDRSEDLKIRQEQIIIRTVAGISQDNKQYVDVFSP